MKIAILGTGSFGTALAYQLQNNANEIVLWGKNEYTIDEINTSHKNSKYFKLEFTLNENVSATNNIFDAIVDAKYIILAVPSKSIKEISTKIKKHLSSNQIIINLSKGIETKTLSRLSELIEMETQSKNIAVLSGPTHAEELIQGMPSTIVLSSKNRTILKSIQHDLSTDNFRIYVNEDIIGVEIGGAAKNIIALASGILTGLNYGDNTKAALMVRGIHEITKIGVILGAKPSTFNGLSGIGDLIVTCNSSHSRNMSAGILFSKGMSISDVKSSIGMTIEGISACEAFHKFSTEYNVDLPITNSIYNIIFENSDVRTEIDKLLTRDLKNEFS